MVPLSHSLSTMCDPIAIDTPCLALIGLLRLSSAEASRLIGRLGRRKGKRARHDGKGKERRKAPFPSPYRPPRAWYISIIAIFIGIPFMHSTFTSDNELKTVAKKS